MIFIIIIIISIIGVYFTVGCCLCECRARGKPGGPLDRNSTEQHPFHLHGHHFWVLGSGDGPYNTTAASTFNLVNPMFRDTQTVPKGGWAVLRFVVRHVTLCICSL